jgi:hypothetical protein
VIPLARRPWLPPALAAAVVLGAASRFPAPSHYPGLRRAAAADIVVGRMLGELPSRAAFYTAHIESAFITGYLRAVEGRRPDVAWAHQGFLASPGYAARLARAEPELPLDFTQRTRPLRMEVDEHLPARLGPVLIPAGLTWRLGAGAYELTMPSARVLGEASGDRQVRGYLAWRAFNDAALACARGLGEAADRNLAVLQRLVPDDLHAVRLRESCGKGAK